MGAKREEACVGSLDLGVGEDATTVRGLGLVSGQHTQTIRPLFPARHHIFSLPVPTLNILLLPVLDCTTRLILTSRNLLCSFVPRALYLPRTGHHPPTTPSTDPTPTHVEGE